MYDVRKYTIRHTHRRGAIGIGMIAVLIVVEMIVIVSVINNSLSHDMTLQRIDTNQAFYASEAGMAVAYREALLNTDEDGDGTIGSISDDNNPNNNPQVGSGTVMVAKSVNLSTTTLTAYGISHKAHRKIKLDLTSQ